MGVLVIMKVTARRACVVSVEGEDNNRHNSIHLKSATSLRRTKTKKKGRSSTSPASGSRTRPVIRKSSKGAILHLRRVKTAVSRRRRTRKHHDLFTCTKIGALKACAAARAESDGTKCVDRFKVRNVDTTQVDDVHCNTGWSTTGPYVQTSGLRLGTGTRQR